MVDDSTIGLKLAILSANQQSEALTTGHLKNHFDVATYLLWHPEYKNREDLEILLQGLPFNPLKRKLKTKILEEDEEEFKHCIENLRKYIGYSFDHVQAIVDFGSLDFHQKIISDKEAIDLSKELENREFQILAYTPKPDFTYRIIYASPKILEQINRGYQYQKEHLDSLREDINKIESLQ